MFWVIVLIGIVVLASSMDFEWKKRAIFLRERLFEFLQKPQDTTPSKYNPEIFDCRVQLTEDGAFFDLFIKGTIYSPKGGVKTILNVSVVDITEGANKEKKLFHAGNLQQLSEFCYIKDMGVLPDDQACFEDWALVGSVEAGQILFARKGESDLRFKVSVLMDENRRELAYAQAEIFYENPQFGYVDLEENKSRAKTLAVAMAFSVASADGKLSCGEVEVIKGWACKNLGRGGKEDRQLKKALAKAVAYFGSGNKLDINKTCDQLTQISTPGQRYEVIKLCLQAVGANESIGENQIELLKSLTVLMDVDREKFRTMANKFLPVSMYASADRQVILGISDDMDVEQIREHLNEEYSKWNSRVTNSSTEIQQQAEEMMQLIAQTRNELVEQRV